jgi:hypothetical protein
VLARVRRDGVDVARISAEISSCKDPTLGRVGAIRAGIIFFSDGRGQSTQSLAA